MDFDDKDKIIFESLMQNCRIGIKELAKRTRLTHPAVLYRIKKLEKEYIQKYDGLINLNRFGGPYSLIWVSVPKRFQKEFENSCKKNKDISSLFRHAHKFNYSLSGFIMDMEKILNYLKNKKLEYEVFTSKKFDFGKFSVYEDIKLSEKEKKVSNKQLNLDELDIKLIEILFDGGGRDSVLELSRKLKINAELASYRFKRLNRAGYFVHYIAQPNMDKFNIRLEVVGFEVKGIEFNEFFNIINQTKKLSFFAYDGKNKYFCTLLIKSLEELEKTIGDIREELDNRLIDLEIYPVKSWLFLNRLNLKRIL